MKRYFRFDEKKIKETIEKLNLRLGEIIGCKHLFFWDENSDISQIALLLKKWKSHEQVFDEEYKEIFVKQEISIIEKNFISMFYTKRGEDKTDFDVH